VPRWNLVAHNGGLGADDFGEDSVQRLPATAVVVAVPRRPAEMLKQTQTRDPAFTLME
jgi:hypothetical protein